MEEARTLLRQTEKLVTDYPLQNDLRAAIASAEGNSAQALALSKYLDHETFFYLYYQDKYRVELPE